MTTPDDYTKIYLSQCAFPWQIIHLKKMLMCTRFVGWLRKCTWMFCTRSPLNVDNYGWSLIVPRVFSLHSSFIMFMYIAQELDVFGLLSGGVSC